jgi:hypothetical protein
VFAKSVQLHCVVYKSNKLRKAFFLTHEKVSNAVSNALSFQLMKGILFVVSYSRQDAQPVFSTFKRILTNQGGFSFRFI